MKIILLVICCFLVSGVLPGFAQSPKVKYSDFEPLTGKSFTGTITYYNHQTQAEETAHAVLTVTPSVHDKNSWNFKYEFPDEPKENDTETITLVSGGKFLNDQEVVDRQLKDKGLLRIVTEDTKAHTQKVRFFAYRYLIGENSFSIKIVEQLRGEESFRPVRTYEFKR